jgi:hypothetical protein
MIRVPHKSSIYWFIDQLMIEVSRSSCITPIDDEIMPFDNAMMDITQSIYCNTIVS